MFLLITTVLYYNAMLSSVIIRFTKMHDRMKEHYQRIRVTKED